jgi:sulfate/thiosulfate transport system permease protein
VADAAIAVARPRRRAVPFSPLTTLGPPVVMLYLSVIVVLPVAALISTAWTGQFWSEVWSPHNRAVIEFTVEVAFAVAIIDAITGLALAWVLVRDEFWGKNAINGLIDLPFALPTIVAGLVLLSLYGHDSPIHINVAGTRIAVLFALLFVTLPFVTRAVQPVLLNLERDVEDAAACLGAGPITTFRRVTLPALAPALITGSSLAFARALGEYGSIILLSGGLPHTEVGSVLVANYVEDGNVHAAAAISVVLLVFALAVFLLLNLVTRRWTVRSG